ncbi:MAG: hypothetical protein GX220_06985 [Treponema sp.]|nr:hypothetical protein [Treponema sp.]
MKKVYCFVKPFFIIISFLVASFLSAQMQNSFIPDSSRIRSLLVQKWFEQDLEILRYQKSEIYQNEVGINFQIRMEEQNDTFSLIVSPGHKILVDVIKNGNIETIEAESYPAETTGSWVLIRDKKTQKPVCIKWFFHTDSQVYVQFRPNGKKTLIDFLVFDAFFAKDVPMGLKFENIYGLSFVAMKKITVNTLPWEVTDVNKGMYSAIHQMVEIIRENLERIVYDKNIVLDEDGKHVNITTGEEKIILKENEQSNKLYLSSAGFAKWIIDGLSIPITGSALRIEPLKVPTQRFASGSLNETVNAKYNINFSLDWTRHLAAASLSITSGKTLKYNASTVDVSVYPFSYVKTEKGIERASEFIKNVGYDSKVLKPLFFCLATTEPDYFYLCAIRESNHRTPEVLYFNEVAIVFPWFDESGHFLVTVFESGIETSLDSFIRRYSDNYVHLTRVKASEYFKVQ